MRFCFTYILCIFGAFNGCAQDLAPIELPEMKAAGKIYTQVKISKNNDYEALLHHEGGIARIPLEILPKDLRDKLGYDRGKSDIAKQQVLKARRASLAGISERIAQEEKARVAKITAKEQKAEEDDEKKFNNELELKKVNYQYGSRIIESRVSRYYCELAVRRFPDLRDNNSRFFLRVISSGRKITYSDMKSDDAWPFTLAEKIYNQDSMGVEVSQSNSKQYGSSRGEEVSTNYYAACKVLASEATKIENKKRGN